jgi:hypothetical protein
MRSAATEGESWPRFGACDAPHINASMEGGRCRLMAGRQFMGLALLGIQ